MSTSIAKHFGFDFDIDFIFPDFLLKNIKTIFPDI